MGFNYLVRWDSSLSLERVDVLCEAGMQLSMLMEETNEDMGGSRYEPARRNISSECIN
jgi:hypothetical protein